MLVIRVDGWRTCRRQQGCWLRVSGWRCPCGRCGAETGLRPSAHTLTLAIGGGNRNAYGNGDRAGHSLILTWVLVLGRPLAALALTLLGFACFPWVVHSVRNHQYRLANERRNQPIVTPSRFGDNSLRLRSIIRSVCVTMSSMFRLSTLH